MGQPRAPVELGAVQCMTMANENLPSIGERAGEDGTLHPKPQTMSSPSAASFLDSPSAETLVSMCSQLSAPNADFKHCTLKLKLFAPKPRQEASQT